MVLAKLLLTSAAATLISGQLIRLDLFSGAITLSDIFAFLAFIAFIAGSISGKRSIKFPKSTTIPAVLFFLACLASTILAINFFSSIEILVALFFLARFFIYFFLSIIAYNLISKEEIINWLHFLLLIGFAFSLLGIIQLVIFPDISFLQAYGWDPHQMRLVSTILDPNYTGGIVCFFAAVATSLYLFKKRIIYLALAIFFTITVFLTFSRSSYLALLFTMFTIGAIKSPRVILLTLTFFLLVFFSVPQAKDRIIGGLTIDDTASARLQSWQKAIVIFKDNPVLGVGFNTYRFAQAKYDFFTQRDPLGGHSGAGSDSSFLFVAATTGLLGSSFFLILILAILKNFAKNSRHDFLKLASVASFTGILIHAQFVNSFFFPQMMLLFWFIVGLNFSKDG